ncbi:uncharacterized protein LOC141657974 [Silene latifolia]|uniref:uncharacterized protein LOC141657974 n=1 Tax=Silene latifolia TaxID=37657 RepID=UPI003D77AFC6
MESLRYNTKDWVKKGKKNHFGGPLLFLMSLRMTTLLERKRVMEDMVVLDEKYAVGLQCFPENNVLSGEIHLYTSTGEFSFDLGLEKDFLESKARLAAAKGVKRDRRVTGESSSATKRVHFMASPSYIPLSSNKQQSSRFDPLFSAIQDDTNVLTPLTAVHLQVADYVFSDRGTNNRRSSEHLYSYKTYFATRMHLWSLKPSEHVLSVVIDCWSSYLNCKEEENNLGTPKRFFFTTLVHSVLAKPSPGLSDEKIYELFEARANMELQLFPGIEIASIALIDAFGRFLGENPKTSDSSNIVLAIDPIVAKLSWRNNYNVDDCEIHVHCVLPILLIVGFFLQMERA